MREQRGKERRSKREGEDEVQIQHMLLRTMVGWEDKVDIDLI